MSFPSGPITVEFASPVSCSMVAADCRTVMNHSLSNFNPTMWLSDVCSLYYSFLL